MLSLQRPSYFSDILWAVSEGKSIQTQTSQEMKNYILSTKSVKEAIKQLAKSVLVKAERELTVDGDKIYIG